MRPKKRTPKKKKRHLVADNIPKDVQRAPSTFEEISTDLKSAGWGKDELTQEIEKAFCNIGVSFMNLKPHFELLQKAHEIFVSAHGLMSWKELDGFIALSLFGRTFSCFLGAVRLSCSGQLTETWILLRASIENSLYAFYIFGNLERAEIWVNRHKDEDSKRKCRSTFMVSNIWKELKNNSAAIEKEAKKFYDRSIDWGAHPNERSLFTNMMPKHDGSGYSFLLVNANPALIRATVIATINASLLTFKIYTLVFPEAFSNPNIDVKIKNLNKQSKPLMAILVEQLKQLESNKQIKVR